MSEPWRASSFAYRIECTVPAPSANLAAHPFPIVLTGRNIPKANCGADTFVAYDSNGNRLNHGPKAVGDDGTYKTGVVFVAADQYSSPSGSQNHIWLYYDASATDGSNTATAVWDSDFVRVYPLGDGATLSAKDFTSYGADGTKSSSAPTAASGNVDGSARFVSSNTQYIEIPTTNLPVNATVRTTSLWFLLASTEAQEFLGYGNNADRQRWGMYFPNNGTLMLEGASRSNFFAWTADTTTWHHFVCVLPTGKSNFSDIAMYLDGVPQSTSVSSDTWIGTTVGGDGAAIGGLPVSGSVVIPTNGWLSDVRISKIDRSAAWIAQDYAVVHTGLTYGSIESNSSGSALTVSFSDSLSLSDSDAKRPGKSIAESLALSEAVVKAHGKVAADIVALADGFAKSAAKSQAESVAVVDALAKIGWKLIEDAVALADATAKAVAKSMVERIAVQEGVAKAVGKALSELIGVSDGFAERFIVLILGRLRARDKSAQYRATSLAATRARDRSPRWRAKRKS